MNGLGCGGVVRRVSWCEGNRQSIRASRKNVSGCWRIDEGTGNGSSGVELGRRECGAIGDARRCSPGDRRDGLSDDELNRLGDCGVVGRVGRSEGDRKSVGSGGRYCTSRRRVDKGSRNRSCRVELRGGERGAVGDGWPGGPGDNRSSLSDDKLDCLGYVCSWSCRLE